MFTDLENPSVWHVEMTKHGSQGYEIAIKRGTERMAYHPKLVKSFKRAWDIGEEMLHALKPREKPHYTNCNAYGIPGASCQFPKCDC